MSILLSTFSEEVEVPVDGVEADTAHGARDGIELVCARLLDPSIPRP